MKIAALEPFLAEILISYGFGESLAGVSYRSGSSKELVALPKVTRVRPAAEARDPLAGVYKLERAICTDMLEERVLRSLNPDTIVTRVPGDPDVAPAVLSNLKEDLTALLGHEVRLLSYAPRTLDEVFAAYEEIGKDFGAPERGKDLAHRQKAQFMDWCDNFYERMRNKKVSFISGFSPFKLGGLWIPEMIRLASAYSQVPAVGQDPVEVEWQEIRDYRPDVILVAPEGTALLEAVKSFTVLEKLPGWEDLPAVKRGEVYFTDGVEHFYQPGFSMIESMAILISALAGFESGYITPRDSFYRLRWLEMQRHRF